MTIDTSLLRSEAARSGQRFSGVAIIELCDEIDRLRYQIDSLALSSSVAESERDELKARLDQLREEMDASRIPALEKMARDANRACVEQWNRADALQARFDSLHILG